MAFLIPRELEMRILIASAAVALFVGFSSTAAAQVADYLRSSDMLRDPASGQWVNARLYCRGNVDRCDMAWTATQRFCNGSRARERAARDRDERYSGEVDYQLRIGDSRRGVTVRGRVDPFAAEYQGAEVSASTDVESCRDFRDQLRRVEREEDRAVRYSDRSGSASRGSSDYEARFARWRAGS